jgi:putative spermidine/putrescine transport system permease protein
MRADKNERAALTAIIILFAIYLIGPTLLIIPQSFSTDNVLRFPPNLFSLQWYEAFLTDRAWIEAIVRSLKIGILATVLATLIALLAAFSVQRSSMRWKRAVEFFSIAPLIIPPIIIASGGYSMFVSLGMIGSDLSISLVHAVLGTPYVYIVVSASLARSDPNLELAALISGASPMRIIRDITVPLNLPSVLTGALFAFLISFDEVILTIFLSGSLAPTLPVRMFSSLALAVSPVIAAVSVAQIILALALLVVLKKVEEQNKQNKKRSH